MAASKKDQSVSFEHVGDPTHSAHLLEGLNLCRQEAAFCDVTVIVGGQRFPAHKAVLTSASDYFHGMFSSGFQERTMSEVTVPGTAESFAQILDFMYTGNFELSFRTVAGILEMACYMVLTKAVKLCTKYLENVKDMCPNEDCLNIWLVAIDHSNLSDSIAQLYRRPVVQNFLMCVQSQAFLDNCTARVMIEILGDEDIESDSITEEQILEGTLVWLKHDWEQRKVHAFDLLKKIRLGLIPIDRLHQILGDELLSIPECKDLVVQIVHLNDTVDTDSPLLLNNHPEFFATRNTISAMMYADLDVEAGCLISLICKTETGCHELTKIADVPSLFPYREIDGLGTSVTVCVSKSGRLFAVGGKEILNNSDSRMQENFDWLSKNNFYRYDSKKNQWITVPPLEDARFDPLMCQVDECLYCFATPVKNWHILKMTMEKYSFASNKWEVVTYGLGYVASVREVNGYMLIKHVTHSDDQSDPANENEVTVAKIALYKIGDDRVYDVTPEVNLEVDSRLSKHNGEFYLVTESGKVHSIRCINFDSEEPSIAIADEAVHVVDAEIIKEVKDLNESVEFTFNKRRLGMMQVPCECASHNKDEHDE